MNDPVCRKCKEPLTKQNSLQSDIKNHSYICRNCKRLQMIEIRKKNPEVYRAQSKRGHIAEGKIPMDKNKECSMYLGVHIAERVLSKVFKDVQRMPVTSGKTLPFKIDCDYLNNDDIYCIAEYIASKCNFGMVIGIPSGGDRLAEALEQYVKPDAPFNVLIVDDVLTTGQSMEHEKASMPAQVHQDDIIGWVIFARTEPPKWINCMFKTSEDDFK